MSAPTSGVLARELGPWQLFSLAFGAILGAGWIVALGQWLTQAGPLGTAVGFFGGAMVVAWIAICYGEVGAQYPLAGGEVVYAERIFGRKAAILTGWFLAVTYIAVCAFEAISIGWISMALVRLRDPANNPDAAAGTTHLVGSTIAIAAVAIVALINSRGVRGIARWQDWLTIALLCCSLVFIAGGFAGGHTQNLMPLVVRDPLGRAWTGVAAVLVTAPFWFSGFGVVAQALGENSSPSRKRLLSVIMIAAILASCAFYVLVVVAAAASMPRSALLAAPLPAAAAFAVSLHSAWLAGLVLFTGLIGLLIALNAIFYSATRVLYALGASGVLPRSFARLDAQQGTPRVACLWVAILSSLASLLSQHSIGLLVDAGAITVSAIYVMVCAAAWRLRAQQCDFSTTLSTRLITLAQPATAMLLAALMVVAGVVTSFSGSSNGLPAELSVVGGAALIGGALLYWDARNVRRARARGVAAND